VRLALSLLAHNLGICVGDRHSPTNRELVVDKSEARAGEDQRTVGQTCALPLATLGGRTSEPAAVRGDAGSDRAVADNDGIDRWCFRLAAESYTAGWSKEECRKSGPQMAQIRLCWRGSETDSMRSR
jgi:hypothetical protein